MLKLQDIARSLAIGLCASNKLHVERLMNGRFLT